jgi:simple sugar transport system permease protein
VLAVATIVVVQRSRLGLKLRAVGLNDEAAHVAGLRPRRYWIGSITASGALAGLGGGLVVLGVRYYLAPGWAASWGFEGVLIAFLAYRLPYLIPLWALLFGMMSAAGPTLEANASVPSAVVTVMQTLPVITLFMLYAVARRWDRRDGSGRLKRRPPDPAQGRPSDGADHAGERTVAFDA